MNQNSNFNNWLDTFLTEKGTDLETVFEIEGEWGVNFIAAGVVVEHIKMTTDAEQASIKTVIVKIDFQNGDVLDFFRHLAQAIAI